MQAGSRRRDATGLFSNKLKQPVKLNAMIRYRSIPSEAVVAPFREGWAVVEFKQPQRAITPGQAVVFYKGDTVAGGAWIKG